LSRNQVKQVQYLYWAYHLFRKFKEKTISYVLVLQSGKASAKLVLGLLFIKKI